MKKDRVLIGSHLRELRKRNGLTQKDVAEVLGIHENAYSQYELDLREPTLSKIIDLAILYQTTTDNILNL